MVCPPQLRPDTNFGVHDPNKFWRTLHTASVVQLGCSSYNWSSLRNGFSKVYLFVHTWLHLISFAQRVLVSIGGIVWLFLGQHPYIASKRLRVLLGQHLHLDFVRLCMVPQHLFSTTHVLIHPSTWVAIVTADGHCSWTDFTLLACGTWALPQRPCHASNVSHHYG